MALLRFERRFPFLQTVRLCPGGVRTVPGALDKPFFRRILTSMIPERVQDVLDRHGLRALAFEPGSTPTSEMAAARIGVEVGQIAKSILMAGKDGRFRLVVLCGDQKVHTTKLKNVTGCKHRMASAEETREATGFPVGGVCPFDPAGLEVYLDQGLGRYDTIYPAAGTDASGVPVTLEHLAAITGGTVCDLTREAS